MVMRTTTASAARLAANRANAQKSTGPRTAEGKARVASNALKHGLRSERNPLDLAMSKGPSQGDELCFADKASDTALPIERDEFQATLAGFIEDLRPIGPFETRLVERLAQIDLRLRRAVRMETAHLDLNAIRVLESAAKALPDDPAAPRTSDNWLLMLAFLRDPAALKLIGQYESRLARDFARTLTQLRQAQKLREQTQAAPNVPESAATASSAMNHQSHPSHGVVATSNARTGRPEPLCAAEPIARRASESGSLDRILDEQTHLSRQVSEKNAARSSGEPASNPVNSRHIIRAA